MASKFGSAYIDVNVRTGKALAKLKAFEKTANAMLDDIDKKAKMEGFDEGGKRVDDVDKKTKGLNSTMDKLGKTSEKVSKKITKGMRDNSSDTGKLRAQFSRLRDSTADLNKEYERLRSKSIDFDPKAASDFDKRIRSLRDRMRELNYTKDEHGIASEKFREHLGKATESIDKERGALGRLSKTISEKNRKITDSSKRVGVWRGVVNKTSESFRRLSARIKSTDGPFAKLNKKLSQSWRRMDSTVRLVLTLIAVAGGPLSAGLSGLGAALAAVASSAYMAGAALLPLGGLIGPLGYGVVMAASGLKDLEKFSTPAAQALEKLKSTFKSIDLPAFMAQWTPALTEFFTNLEKSLRLDDLAQAIGSAFGGITQAFADVFGGNTFAQFTTAMETQLSPALENFGVAAAHIFEGVLAFFTATAPVVKSMSDTFVTWAENWSNAIQSGAGAGGELKTFFQEAQTSLETVIALFSSFGGLMNTVFKGGADTGNILLDTLSQLFDKWNDFLQTDTGQDAMAAFFERGIVVMDAVGVLLEGLGQAFRNMVTPTTTALLEDLFETLGAVLPILGDIIRVVSEMGILNLIADLFLQIGNALKPIMPVLSKLANTIFKALGSVIEALAPILEVLAAVIGEVAEALGPVIQRAAEAVTEILAKLAPVFESVWEAIQPLIPIIADLLVAAINAVLPVVVELIDKLGPLLTSIIQALIPVVESLIPIIDALLPVFANLLPIFIPVINLVAQLAEVLTPLIDLVADLLVWVFELITPFIEFLAPLLEWIAQLLVLNKGIGVVSKAIGNFAKGVATWFKSVIDWVVKLWNRVKQWFDDMVNGVKNMGASFWKWITDLWTKVTGSFSGGVKSVISTVRGWIDDVVSFIANLQTRAVNIVRSLWESIKTRFSNSVQAVYNTVKGWIDKVVNFFSGLWSRISSGIGNIGKKISDKFSGMVGTVKGYIDDIVGWFKGLPDKVGKALQGMGSIITDSIGNAAEKMNPLNWFASGGIVTGPTAAMVGEAGPEAIIPLNRPLHMVDPAVRDMSAALQGKQSNSPLGGMGGMGGGINIAEGAIQVIAPESNPGLVAESVLDRLVAYAR